MANYGSIYTFTYEASHTENNGYISTSSFVSTTTNNYGEISTNTFVCRETKNYGKIYISNNGINNLTNFQLMKGGALYLNGIVIKSGVPLASDVKSYLEELGGEITISGDSITLNGKFKVERESARAKLPHLYSKYDEASSGWEYIPGNWFSNTYTRVSSKSKSTGAEKLWRFKPITNEYTIKKATADVFSGKLSNKIVGCDFTPKAKFDVFYKAVVSRDFDSKKTCSQQIVMIETEQDINSQDTIRDHVLLAYLSKALLTKDSTNFISMLEKTLSSAEKSESSGISSWFYSGLQLFFSSPSEVEIDRKVLNSHSYIIGEVPNKVTVEELVASLTEVIQVVSEDAYKICDEIKLSINAELAQVNCKFTQQEIETQILPEVDLLTETVKNNIAIANKYLEELKLNMDQTSVPRARFIP